MILKTYILTGSTPQAITLRPVLAPSGMGGVTVPWANIASVTTHLGSVIVRTNNRRVSYKVNRGTSDEQRRLVEETFGLGNLATSTTRRVADDEHAARLQAQLEEHKAAKARVKAEEEVKAAERRAAKAEAKATGKEIRRNGDAEAKELVRQIREDGGGFRERFRAGFRARQDAAKKARAINT